MESLTQETPASTSTDTPQNGTSSSSTTSLDFVPEDLKGEKFWSTVKDGPDLARKYSEMVKYQGRSFSIPDEKDQAGWGKVYDRLGRPKDAAAYELKRPELPEGIQYNEPLEQQARAKFHELGLSARQAQGLYSWFMDADKAARESFGNRYAEGQAKLTQEWGASAEKNFALAQKGLFLLCDGNKEHPLVKWLDDSGETFNPVLIKFFHDYAKGVGEDKLAGLEDNTKPMEGTDQIAEWQREIDNLRSDPKSPFNDVRHAGHKAEVERVLGIYRKIAEAKGEE